MNAFVVLAAFLACASANPQIFLSGYSGLGLGLPIAGHHLATQVVHQPVAYAAPAVIAPAVTKTQYHSQDELGQASYGHAHAGNAHAAVRDAFGNVAGSYAYINPEGKEIRVNYIADGAGFRVESNALPIAPTAPPAPEPVKLVPVEDTEEVKEAKAAHAKAIAEAVARNAEAEKADKAEEAEKPQSRRKRGILAAAPVVTLAHAPVVHVAHAPAVTYSAIAAPATIVAAPAVREATLTKIVNNPLHAVSYRVD